MENSKVWMCHPSRQKEEMAYAMLKSNLKRYIHRDSEGTRIKRKNCLFFRLHLNGLIMIVGVYIILFVVASVILLISVLHLQKVNDNHTFQAEHHIHEEPYTFKISKGESNAYKKRPYKDFLWPYKHLHYAFNCSTLSVVNEYQHVSSGWTKRVYSFQWNNHSYALKTVNVNGRDIQNCMRKELFETCYQQAAFKINKEVLFSQELTHPNIIKVRGYCVSDDTVLGNIAVITDLCTPVSTISLLQMTFRQRLHVALELAKLIKYLSQSPLGSIAMNDFRRQQFIICSGTLKLTDLDDLSVQEPKCRERKHCLELVRSSSRSNFTEQSNLDIQASKALRSAPITCSSNRCLGYNEKQNIVNMYKHFVSLFLPINVPAIVRHDVKRFLSNFLSPSWDSTVILKQTELLLFKLCNGNVYNC